MIVDGGVGWFVMLFSHWCGGFYRGVSLRLNLGELGLIVGVCGLFGCVVYGEWFVIDVFMSVSSG